MARLRGLDPRLDRLPEGGSIADDVVGSEHQQQRVIARGHGLEGGNGHGRCGVAAHGLQQDRRGIHADLAHLLGHDEAVVFVADQQRRLEICNSLQTLLGLLQQGLFALAREGPVLLRVTRPG